MGSLGIGEILLIFVVGFILLGPKNLPKLMKNLGKAFGQLASLKNNLTDSLNDVKDSFENTVNEEKKNFDNIKIKNSNKTKKNNIKKRIKKNNAK